MCNNLDQENTPNTVSGDKFRFNYIVKKILNVAFLRSKELFCYHKIIKINFTFSF